MTHQSNYALDRLGVYAFESLVNFVQCYTRLEIRYLPPSHAANLYFALYPNETEPIWTNPCDDKNHLQLWSPNKTCSFLPDLLIVGPQKTGSTALHLFMSLHPRVQSSMPTKHGFEEVQFFTDKRMYRKGLDWYLSLFPTTPPFQHLNTTTSANVRKTLIDYSDDHDDVGKPEDYVSDKSLATEPYKKPLDRAEYVIFEKSATYFDNELAISRIKALLPRTKIVILIEDPARRAYSWYQHQKAKNNRLAVNSSFYEILTSEDPKYKSLRNRCLHPGQYAQHIDKWLMLYPASSLHFVDSQQLRNDPASVMNDLQAFAKIEPVVDYNKLLKFDRNKGFYCPVDEYSKRLHCLGKSKGRKYDEMDEKSKHYLSSYFRSHNLRLLNVLKHLGAKVPTWLQHEFTNVKSDIKGNQK